MWSRLPRWRTNETVSDTTQKLYTAESHTFGYNDDRIYVHIGLLES